MPDSATSKCQTSEPGAKYVAGQSCGRPGPDMDLKFEMGSPNSPRGHALVYFTDASDPSKIGASYIVVLPVNVDIAKYVPPFLAGQIESIGGSDMSSFSFPPAPEPVNSVKQVRAIAEIRHDDLLFGGARRLDNAVDLMGLVGEITAEYRRLYDAFAESLNPDDAPALAADEDEQTGVDNFLYGLMSQSDLLKEVTNLVGKLRYAVEGGDKATAEECELRIRAAGRHMPDNRRADLLADAAAGRGPDAEELARLYVERAYGLLREDYRAVKGVEDRIRQLTGTELPGRPFEGLDSEP